MGAEEQVAQETDCVGDLDLTIVIGIRTSRTLADRGAWARANRTAGYAAVGAGTCFLLAGLLPNLPVMEFAAVAALGVMTMLAWNSWRSRHA